MSDEYVRGGYLMSPEDAKLYDELTLKIDYEDRIQYCYKIKLNSCYGALLNKHFRFHDSRLGESTTGSGRAILRYMCSKINEIQTGVFDHLGDAVLYGDTDSCYFRIFDPDEPLPEDREELIALAIERAEAIAEETNASFREFVRETFLVTDGFDLLIQAGREVVASNGIFVTPKKYMLDVVDLEGNRVVMLKVMGLDTKKTTLPRYVQDELNDRLAEYLRGREWNEVASDIVDFKERMHERDIMDLGLPKGCNKVEAYAAALSADPDTRIPGHVRAAINYNSKLDLYNDTESLRITSGMKVKVFYLKTPEGKFKSIALPTDLPRVPDWFKNNVVVDVDLQIEKLVDNPLKNILTVIDRQPPSRQTMFVDTLLEF